MKTEIWVDGAFINDKPTWAFLVKQDGIETFKDSGTIDDPDKKKYHQVAGELAAAGEALKWAARNKLTHVTIYYDYEGIRAWATGAWKANNPVTKSYKEFTAFMKDVIEFEFVKVKAHSGDVNNNAVDAMTKMANSVSVTELPNDCIRFTYKSHDYVIDFSNMTIQNE